jgi:membrane protein implicated in regulation of membrane protease activity
MTRGSPLTAILNSITIVVWIVAAILTPKHDGLWKLFAGMALVYLVIAVFSWMDFFKKRSQIKDEGSA